MAGHHLLKFCVAGLVLAAMSSADAAELKVFVGGAMTETVEKIGADYAKASGRTDGAHGRDDQGARIIR